MTESTRFSRIGVLCIVVLAFWGVTLDVAAQPGRDRGGFFGQANTEAGYSARHLPLFVDSLQLDEAQETIVGMILEEHESAVRNAEQAFREEMEAMREEGGRGFDRERFATLREETAAQRRRLEAKVENDLKAVLRDDQRQRWPLLERELRRVRSLPQGQLAGESVDLHVVVEEAGLDPEENPGLDQALEAYATELDAALKARDKLTGDSFAEAMREAFGDGGPEEILDMLQKQADARVRVRDVNERHMDIIAALVDEQAAEELHAVYERRAFSRVFEPTPMQRAFDAALDIDGLSDTTRQAIERLYFSFLAELVWVNESLVRTIRRYEPKQREQRLERMAARFSRTEPEEWDDPIDEGFDQRESLGERYRTNLEALLTPEQIDLLPRARDDRNDDRDDWRQRRGRGGFRGRGGSID